MLVSFIISVVLDLNKGTFKDHRALTKPLFIKFYSPQCGHCQRMAPSFEEASEMVPDATFAGVSCLQEKDICQEYKVTGYPTIKLFFNDTTFDYQGDRTVESFVDFVVEKAKVKAKTIQTAIFPANPLNFNKTINKECTFMTFYSPHCGHCKFFLPIVKQLASAFVPEKNVTFAVVDCTRFNELCESENISGFPTIRLYKKGESEPYTGGRHATWVANFVNDKCGTNRAPDGLIESTVGVNQKLNETILDFFNGDEKKKIDVLSEVKKSGEETYVKVLTRLGEKGNETLYEDITKIQGILAKRQSSIASLDVLKTRLNVFVHIYQVINAKVGTNVTSEGTDSEETEGGATEEESSEGTTDPPDNTFYKPPDL